MKLIRHITVCFVLLLLVASCGSREDKVIPRGRLAEIYAEMLLVDQWITTNPGNRYVADTSLVYEPILERYGYTSADYRKSVDVYMDDPERFARILRETGEILNRRLDDLKIKKERLEHLEKLRKEAEMYRPDIKWELTSSQADTVTVSMPDSLDFAIDSSSWIYRLSRVERNDTVYEGVRLVVSEPDTVKVAPEIEKTDTTNSQLRFDYEPIYSYI